MTHAITIFQQGLISFAVCGCCNRKFESKFLNLFKVEKELLEQYRLHKCREVGESVMMSKPAKKSSSTQAASRVSLGDSN